MGGGIGMGNTCKPMAVSFHCMKKSTTNKKKIKIKFSSVQKKIVLGYQNVDSTILAGDHQTNILAPSRISLQ